MKIDIHSHTKKVKAGDSPNRNVSPEDFSIILRQTDVKIFAVTNHNHFDYDQYIQMRDKVADFCQVWPGVELDILENGNRSHLIVIANPKYSKEFGARVDQLIGKTNPDSFTVSIENTVKSFDDFDSIYIAHYFVKRPSLSDEDIVKLTSFVSNPRRVMKEATNALSAGIYISHGHNTIYGSDIHDWAKYVALSKELPDLRLPVESYEQFCFLLERDEATIDTILNRKNKENIQLTLFSAAELFTIDVYNDINILFGSKGTGKTALLDKLSEYYNKKGHQTTVYKSNESHLNDVFNLNKTTILASDLGIDECINEIKNIKEATEVDINTLNKYFQYFEKGEKNKISKKITLKGFEKADDKLSLRKFTQTNKAVESLSDFQVFLDTDDAIQLYLSDKTKESLKSALAEAIRELSYEKLDSFIDSKSIHMLNHIVNVFKDQIAKKTGVPPLPGRTGFVEYAENRIKLEMAVSKILHCAARKIPSAEAYIGSLGEKGELYCKTDYRLQDGTFNDVNFSAVKSLKRPKSSPKEFIKAMNKVYKHIYDNDLFAKIAELNGIDGIETIIDMSCLLLFHSYFTLNGKPYVPSSGESSMILLHRELQVEKDIYLIDEPEKSLGNDYINDVIVPMLKELAQLGKKIIIATHDANIAVRTLPYNSIYRLRDGDIYYTMMGNPFSNKLKCVNNSREALDWKEISMKTLEGGRSAFGERGKIYGN